MTAIRVIAPFRPFPAEAGHHVLLPEFDWMDALRMLQASVSATHNEAVFHVLTDHDTALPLPTLAFHTRTRRLMLWYLEICACYLESSAFDRDTVMLDADQLVYGDLTDWFRQRVDLGILIRPRPKNRDGLPILNGVQFWHYRGRARLAAFYRRALAIAETLPEADVAWGADTLALERLLAPLTVGIHDREGLRVRLIDSDGVIEALSEVQIKQLTAGRPIMRSRPVLDFRNLRKPYMRRVFEQTYGVPA